MGASDRERAERHALGLLRTLAKRHRDDLARLSRAEDVWTALAEPDITPTDTAAALLVNTGAVWVAGVPQ